MEQTGAVFTAEQQATFRAAGFWMRIVGWAEVVGGGLFGVVWVLAALGVDETRQMVGGEWVVTALQCVAGVGVGILTLVTAASFRRAGPDAAAVTAAVANLRELYERQVWLILILVFVVIGSALVR